MTSDDLFHVAPIIIAVMVCFDSFYVAPIIIAVMAFYSFYISPIIITLAACGDPNVECCGVHDDSSVG